MLTQLIRQGEKGDVRTAVSAPKPRQFGTLKAKIKILDPDWAKPQNNVEAWLRGDV